MIEKWAYLGNGLTDWHEIWYGDAYWPSEILTAGTADVRHLKKWKNDHISAAV